MASPSSSKVRLLAATSSKALSPCSAAASRSRLASARFFSTSTTHFVSTSRGDPSTSSSSAGQGLTGSDKLLQEALRLEEEEEVALSKQSRRQDPNDPIWTGEERVQDTVLRMVMDKYKPLRVRLGDENKDPADEKIKAGIQTPSPPAASSSSAADDGASKLFVSPSVEGAHEDGRKLPKTPDQKPWRAVYVRPAHLLGVGAAEEFAPSIYYGQFLKSSSSTLNASSEARNKLKAAGVNVSALPLDDPKAMKQLRQGIKTVERRGKLMRARDSVIDYQLSQHSSSEVAEEQEGEIKGDQVSDTNRNLQLQLGHAQGWDSVIEKRIKAALESGLFKDNKLRGKPIKRDMQEKNPFLAREEYFMNRIVKRQGAAPPWVELNMELETELRSWRQRFDDSWVRRATRMITTSPTLGEGLEALPLPAAHGSNALSTGTAEIAAAETGAEAKLVLEVPAARTAGEQRLIDVASRFRDPEWEARERAYHTHEMKRLNDLVRKHNHLAPFTARKGLMVLDVELAAMWTRTLPRLVYEVSAVLHAKANGGQSEGKRVDGWDALLQKEGGGAMRYDLWGTEVRQGASAGSVEKGRA
ncbi:hypothetical protein EX895_002218 [Sporisorium graminicola]|uniref:DnaJ homologue subfamily C member 28 conserved domain-containing protein n=1 Tax=Sporisorium graminicola TaxID=280036 RepID=A0A4U7KXJ5_9BASI|nr:hypothetical protein EX895_002218 [Sporisorium graminicola]TKY88977.1 hypothetical protein EX895_002218 [Sporisorium graminicola]